MRHGSCSLKLPHTPQKPTCSRTARIASASRSASSFGARSKWSASRWALFCPMLGSFDSSSMSCSRTFELYMGPGRLEGEVDAARQASQRLFHVRFRGALRLTDGGDDQVFEQRDVAVLECILTDLQLLQHLATVDDCGHDPAARTCFEALVGELLLHFVHLLLHLLRLLHQVAKALHASVLSDPRPGRSITSPSNQAIARSIIGRTSSITGGRGAPFVCRV